MEAFNKITDLIMDCFFGAIFASVSAVLLAIGGALCYGLIFS